MLNADALTANLRAIEARIQTALARAGRASDAVRLVVVSKTWPVEVMRPLYEAGVRDFGESYIQEWREKRDLLPDDVRWHIIGHLQSNKVKYLEGRAHLIHSVDRASVLKEMARRDGTFNILLQVNTSKEATKHGTDEVALFDLLDAALASSAKVSVHGLMTIPAPAERPEDNLPAFMELERLRAACAARIAARGLSAQHPCHELSMGMSDDFEAAIEAGATLVRVGSAIFGPRDNAT
jgi:pyridoxal phosphate enzyme (YggS family)